MQSWRDTLLLDVPMRGVIAAAQSEPLREGDPRFERDGVVLVTDGGRFAYCVRRGSTWLHGALRAGPDASAHASETLSSAARDLGLFVAVVDTDGTPIGLLGWDDVVRFALARGGDDACWGEPASATTRLHSAITPVAGVLERRLGPVRTVRDVAQAMLRVPPALYGTNDAAQALIGEKGDAFGGFVTPRDLLRAIFAP
jgi:hypothetical protein